MVKTAPDTDLVAVLPGLRANLTQRCVEVLGGALLQEMALET